MAQKRGKLIVVSAPSGCGKTTVVERLLWRNPNLVRSISYTTRPPRPAEADGKDYFFVSEDEFQEKRKKGFFLEWAKVFGRFYGTSREFVEAQLVQGRDVVLAIDVQGARQLRKTVPSEFRPVFIFMMPPSKIALKRRLAKRHTETKGEVEERLRVAEEEMGESSHYDHVVVNRRIDQTVKAVEGVIQ